MSDEIRKKVISDLSSLPEMEKRIELLRYEMEHRGHVSPDDMISAMTFGRESSVGAVSGNISNKTLYIALNYQKKMEEANEESTNDIAGKLWLLEEGRDRILHYVNLLDDRQAAIIRLTYFTRKTNEEAAKDMDITVRTVRRLKAGAINRLCELYAFAGRTG